MKKDIFTGHIPSYDLCEYLLVARPGNEVIGKIKREVLVFYEEHNEELILATEPGITIVRFSAYEGMEETIIRWMQRVFSNQQGFPITLDNYGGFPVHTIYLRVQNAQPFEQLVKQLKVIDTYITSCLCPPMKVNATLHLNISGNLSEELYYKALSWYAHRSFHQSFAVQELFLLRRKHQFDQLKTVNVFGLQPGKIVLPVTY